MAFIETIAVFHAQAVCSSSSLAHPVTTVTVIYCHAACDFQITKRTSKNLFSGGLRNLHKQIRAAAAGNPPYDLLCLCASPQALLHII